MTHEAFHIFFNNQITIQKWPHWILETNRNDVAKCFILTPEVKDAYAEEYKSLLAAFNSSDKSSLIGNLQSYFTLRQKRYALLKKYTFELAEKKQSCHEGEIKMELDEGAADFAGLETLMNAGLLDYSGLNTYLINNGASYYQSGATKLLIIKKLSGTDFFGQLSKIAAAQSWSGGTDYILKSLIGK